MDKMIREKIERFVADHEEALFGHIARLVAINSVEGDPEPDAPFGPGPRAALEEALDIAEELGLETENCDNYIGWAQVPGEREDYLATITHVDIVPVGNGWTGDPLKMREQDGYIFGRGVMDDKGPSILCLYALKFLKESGIPLRYPVKALLGANEESGMGDVEYFNEHCPAPLFCFSPDADFPLIHGEKGIFHCRMTSGPILKGLIGISGGVAVNAVPDRAEAWLSSDKELPSTDKVTASRTLFAWTVKATGVAGHASMPEGAESAIRNLILYLLEQKLLSPEEEKFLCFLKRIQDATDGSGVGIQADDGLFTPLTVVNGMISAENGRISATLDCRYPTNTSGERILELLKKEAGDLAEFEVLADAAPFYKSPDSPEIRACLEAYREITGSDARPFTIGGGTYARHFPNAIAFGPEHPELPRPDFFGAIHGANEAAKKSELLEALKIYILTLLKLEESEL